MINWKVRIRNRAFWVALIPAVLLLLEYGAAMFGIQLELGQTGDRMVALVNQLFVVLAILGIVNDPTTAGLGDSENALTYQVPKGK